MVWSIGAAKRIPEIVEILVSTDDPMVASISRRHGCLVPWLRPKHLASARAPSSSAAIHALNWYEKKICKVDGVLLLQPTSPFRTKASIRKAISLFKKNQYLPVVSVVPSQSKKSVLFEKKNKFGRLVDKNNTEKPPASGLFEPNGNLYLCSPHSLRTTRSFFGKKFILLRMASERENLDIDTQEDFSRGKAMLARGRR